MFGFGPTFAKIRRNHVKLNNLLPRLKLAREQKHSKVLDKEVRNIIADISYLEKHGCPANERKLMDKWKEQWLKVQEEYRLETT
ncbi:hypothetical protein ACFL96_12685 [Thermoproteota archaeon]